MTLDDSLKKIKNKKPLLAGVIAIGAFLIANHFLIQPGLAQLKKLNEEVRLAQGAEPALRRLAEIEAQITQYNAALARPADSVQIIEELSQIASRSGLLIQSINPEPPSRIEPGFERLPIRLGAMGTIHELGSFAAAVESLKYFVKVANVGIESSPDRAVESAAFSAPKADPLLFNITVYLIYPSTEGVA